MGDGEFRKHALRRRNGVVALHGLALLGIALVGLGLGFAVGFWPSRDRQIVAQLPYAAPSATSVPVRTPVATPIPRPAPTLAPTPARTLAPTVAATVAPTVAPAAPPAVAHAPAPTTASVTAAATTAGAWRITEANRQIGTMIWSGSGAASPGGTIILQLHKVAVAGQPATACERATTLQAQIAAGIPQQTVPFRETNCAGTTSTGTVHVNRFAAGGRAFDGTFAENGALVGDFIASER